MREEHCHCLSVVFWSNCFAVQRPHPCIVSPSLVDRIVDVVVDLLEDLSGSVLHDLQDVCSGQGVVLDVRVVFDVAVVVVACSLFQDRF